MVVETLRLSGDERRYGDARPNPRLHPRLIRFSLVRPSLGARPALGMAALLLAAACASTTAPAGRRGAAPVQAGAAAVSYDWHGLLLLPFGTVLRQSPFPVHEVLLFHDDSQPADDSGGDCYAGDSPPRLAGRPLDQYLLCFDHDRLSSIRAWLTLGAGEAAEFFAHACAQWLKSPALPPAGSTCEGRDGAIAFSARLGPVPGQPWSLVLTLTSAAARDADDAADAAPRK